MVVSWDAQRAVTSHEQPSILEEKPDDRRRVDGYKLARGQWDGEREMIKGLSTGRRADGDVLAGLGLQGRKGLALCARARTTPAHECSRNQERKKNTTLAGPVACDMRH